MKFLEKLKQAYNKSKDDRVLHYVAAKIGKRATISATVIRADGRREDLGVISRPAGEENWFKYQIIKLLSKLI